MYKLLLLLLAANTADAAEQYFYKREAGTLHIAREPISPDFRAVYPSQRWTVGRLSAAERAEWRRRLEPSVALAAKQAGIDAALLDAIILAESGYDPRAVSKKGALGLLQLMPETVSMFEVADPFDPHKNLAAGSRYFAILLNEFKDMKLALAAYNAGPVAVRRAGGVPNYPETIQYVRTIMSLYERSSRP